jgi:hypothetical protein
MFKRITIINIYEMMKVGNEYGRDDVTWWLRNMTASSSLV